MLPSRYTARRSGTNDPLTTTGCRSILVVREQSQIERVLDALPPVKEFLEEAYRSPYVEDWFEEDEGYESVTSKDELDIETTLTPGMNHYLAQELVTEVLFNLNEEEYRDILLGEGDLAKTLSQLPPHLHDFVYDCYKPAHLRKISEADVSKFLTGKPELSDAEIRQKLPLWLQDKLPAFLPRHADTLPPRRAWDHKIELMPGKEPPYFKNRPLSPLELEVVPYLDDVLVYSADKSEHREHVRTIVQKLADAGLQIDINKCEFETVSTRYLGLIITTNDIGWIWDASHRDAFATLKDAFITAPVLAYFDHNKRTVLETDASDWASGGVLSQYDSDGLLRPVAYFSAKHSAAECNYEIYDKELLAIIKSMEEWRPELQGSKAIRPDALSRKREDRPNFATGDDERLKNRERIVLPADKFDIDLYNELKAGIHLAPTDLVVPAEDKPIDELIDDAYRRSDMAHQLIAAIEDHHVRKWPVEFRKTLRVAMQDCYVANNRIYYRERLWIPPDDELKVQIIYRMHSSGPAGHPGRTKTIDLVSRTYWWPQMHQEDCFIRASMRALYAHKVIKVGPTRIPTPITSPLSSLV
ncbi:hypothetical protein DID88_009818 [Monilinia fructigena]|uniref:Integrase zinc-binding domain-containing protein n=1 Tax=Monilinia fructigena TaxID=38457 RepID=A0A395IK08_9HELO|nr:hypothetical protein DID88_009818 [Monilinia fructigena]